MTEYSFPPSLDYMPPDSSVPYDHITITVETAGHVVTYDFVKCAEGVMSIRAEESPQVEWDLGVRSEHLAQFYTGRHKIKLAFTALPDGERKVGAVTRRD